MMSLEILMTKFLLLTEKANVTQMLPKKVRYLSRITIFLKKITIKKAIIFPLHAWHKEQKKIHQIFLTFFGPKNLVLPVSALTIRFQLYILTNAFEYAETFCIDGPSSCRTTDTLSQFNVLIESLRLGVLIPCSI